MPGFTRLGHPDALDKYPDARVTHARTLASSLEDSHAIDEGAGGCFRAGPGDGDECLRRHQVGIGGGLVRCNVPGHGYLPPPPYFLQASGDNLASDGGTPKG